MSKSFGPCSMNVSIAPSQGLFLEMSYFDLYCNRPSYTQERINWSSDPGTGAPDSEAAKRCQNFKDDVIVPHIMAEEEKELNFLRYMINQVFYKSIASEGDGDIAKGAQPKQ